jgi:5-methylcytosine-specific restriction endonuclease McrA
MLCSSSHWHKDFGHRSIPKIDPVTSYLICPNCGEESLSRHKTARWTDMQDCDNTVAFYAECQCCPFEGRLSFMDHCGNPLWSEWKCEILPGIHNAHIIAWCKENQVEIPEWIQPKRQPIKPSLRFEILKRDNYRCQMCGATAKDGATLEIDHIHPVSKGGTNQSDNLQVLCRDCNAGKSDQWQ